MKKLFALVAIVAVLLLCCSCTVNSSQKGTPEKYSQQKTEEEKQEQLLKDAETVADRYIQAFFNAKYNEANAFSCPDFKQQVAELNKSHPDGDLYYDGDKVIWDGKTFESTERCLERLEEMFNSMSLQNYEIQDKTLFDADSFADVVEQKEIPEANLFTDGLGFSRFAIVDYNVVMQVEDASPQGVQMETHEGTVSVLLLYVDEQWKVYSPSMIGIFTGYVYFK